MRIMRPGPLFAFCFLVSATPLSAQQSTTSLPPTRDPQAIALLQASVQAMGGNAAGDSSATGSINIVEGSLNEDGTVEILTLGMNQTAENISLTEGTRSIIYSYGEAKEIDGTRSVFPILDLIVTDQCADFPLPLLLAALNRNDEGFKYFGQETLNGVAVQHIEIWDSFSSKPKLRRLAAFSKREVWLDAASNLPVKIAYKRQAGAGTPSIPLEISFSNYKNVSGIQYPFQIKKSYNGTPCQTITIQNVSFNTGLTNAQFPTQ